MLWIGLMLGVLALVGLDQLTKWLATTYLMERPLVLIQGVLELRYSENEGAAWGIFSGARWPLVVLTVVLMAAVIAMLWSRRFRSYNLIDRAVHGFVVDFIYVRWIDFPIFNVADCCVVIGAALMLIFLMFVYREDDPPAGSDKSNGEEQATDETGNMDGSAGTGGGAA